MSLVDKGKKKSFFQSLQSTSLKASIFKAFNLSLANQILPLATSLWIFWYVKRDVYGLYHVLYSIVGLSELFLAGLDSAILRFWSSNQVSSEKKQILFQQIVALKVGVTLFFLSTFFILSQIPAVLYRVVPEEAKSLPLQTYLYLAFFFTLSGSLTLTVSKCFVSKNKFGYIFKLTLIREILTFAGVAILLYFEKSFAMVLSYQLSIYLILLVFNVSYLWKNREEFHLTLQKFSRDAHQEVFQEYLKNYSLPLSASSVLTYAKNQLPIILLSHYGQKGFELAGTYKFLRGLFVRIHKLSSSYLGYLIPRFGQMFEDQRKYFQSRFNLIFQISFAFRFSGLVFLFFFGHWILDFLEIPPNDLEYRFILLMFALELAAADLSTFNHHLLLFEKQTKFILYSSVIRAIIEVPLIFYLPLNFGGPGAALTLYLARFGEGFTLILKTARLGLLRYQMTLSLLLFGLFLYFFSLNRSLFGV